MWSTGGVLAKHVTANVRRRQFISDEISLEASAGVNLLTMIGKAPPNSRFAVESITRVNEVALASGDAAANTTVGALKIGHATAAGTFDDDSILAATAMSNSAAKVATTWTHSNFASTLKTGSNAPQNAGLPIVPAGASIWATSTEYTTNGDGTFRLCITGWELDDEQK